VYHFYLHSSVNSRFDTHLLSFQGLSFEHQQVIVLFDFTVDLISVEREKHRISSRHNLCNKYIRPLSKLQKLFAQGTSSLLSSNCVPFLSWHLDMRCTEAIMLQMSAEIQLL